MEIRLQGPLQTPFESGQFVLNVKIPQDYPSSPPLMTFKTRIFHPNIHFETGQICMEGLNDNWTPALTLKSLLEGILQLLQVS